MASSFLSQPVTLLARSTHPLAIEDSIELAVARLREGGAGILPLVDQGRYKGSITERSLAIALARGVELTEWATAGLDHADLRIPPYITGAEALRLISELGGAALVVVDDAGRVLGVITPSDLYPHYIPPPRPPLIGGMATPFGVYLTTGVVRAGASDLALVTSGMILFCILAGSLLGAEYLGTLLLARGVSASIADVVASVGQLVIFALAMRLIPLSGIHAAEHKVVHAIERGEALRPEIVRRMPRVHPRCGTNLAVGATLFLALATSTWISDEVLRLLLALVATLALWRLLGGIVQKYVTTSPPSEKQLQMGIRSGQELLRKYLEAPVVMPNFFQRIYNSGMLHVMAGSLICTGVAYLIGLALHLDLKVY